MADTAVLDYLDKRDTETTEYAPYQPRPLDGTAVIPDDVVEGINALLNTAVEKKTKQTMYTMYDKYGLPWKVTGDRLTMMLQEKTEAGERMFFATVPQTAPVRADSPTDKQIKDRVPVLLQVKCPICPNKIIPENPWTLNGAQPVIDRDDEAWRKDIMLFQHIYKRHKNQVPRYFRDKDRRDDLARFVA